MMYRTRKRTGIGGLAIASILALAIATAPQALAADLGPTSTSGATPITATLDSTYTISIPATMTLTYNDYSPVASTIAATNVKLPSGKSLYVMISGSYDNDSKNGFKIFNGTNSVDYGVYEGGVASGNKKGSGEQIATFDSSTPDPAPVAFSVKVDNKSWSKALSSGAYTGNLVFTISIS